MTNPFAAKIRRSQATRLLESAGTYALNFEDIKALVSSSRNPHDVIAGLLYNKRLRPKESDDCLRLMKWVTSYPYLPKMLASNAAISLAYTALHVGHYPAALDAEKTCRELLNQWSEMPKHPRDPRRNRVHLYFSHVSVSWPIFFLERSVDSAIKELERGREFFFALGPQPLGEAVHASLIPNASRMLAVDSAFSFARGDLHRIRTNKEKLVESFRDTLRLLNSTSDKTKAEFLSATKSLVWHQELIEEIGEPIPKHGRDFSQSRFDLRGYAARRALDFGTKVTGVAREAIAGRFRELLSG